MLFSLITQYRITTKLHYSAYFACLTSCDLAKLLKKYFKFLFKDSIRLENTSVLEENFRNLMIISTPGESLSSQRRQKTDRGGWCIRLIWLLTADVPKFHGAKDPENYVHSFMYSSVHSAAAALPCWWVYWV